MSVIFGTPAERRIVIFADAKTIYQLQNDPLQRKFLINSELRVINLHQSSEFLEEFSVLGGVIPHNNMLMVLSPFDDITYMEASEAKNQIALDKLGSTIHVAQILGAKNVEVLNLKIHDKASNESISINGKYGVGSGKLSSKEAHLQNLKNQIKLHTTFTGSEPNYSGAKQFLQHKRLLGDVFLSKLLAMRNHDVIASNPLQSIIQEICMTENLQRTFDLVAKIEFPTGYFDTSYQTIRTEKTEIYFTIKIDF